MGEERETVHLACLDAPETQHQFAELAWFGRATLSAVQLAVKRGAEVCLTELTPPLRGQGRPPHCPCHPGRWEGLHGSSDLRRAGAASPRALPPRRLSTTTRGPRYRGTAGLVGGG